MAGSPTFAGENTDGLVSTGSVAATPPDLTAAQVMLLVLKELRVIKAMLAEAHNVNPDQLVDDGAGTLLPPV